MAEVSREPGVLKVDELLLAQGASGAVATEVPLRGLQLPQIAGLSVEVGSAVALDTLRGTTATSSSSSPPERRVVPVPVIPSEC
jgi:hypothetical protein